MNFVFNDEFYFLNKWNVFFLIDYIIINKFFKRNFIFEFFLKENSKKSKLLKNNMRRKY